MSILSLRPAVSRLVLVLGVLGLCRPVLAQSTATLQGTVTDPSGGAVKDAKVVVHNQATGQDRTARTDAQGVYSFPALSAGVYRVEVQAEGFQTRIVNELVVEVARNISQNVQLQMGNVTEEVTVSSDAPVVDTSTISVGTVINERTVQEIPLNGRHFVDLGLLIPGSVAPQPATGFLTAPLRGQGSFAFNTAGNREDTVNFMINGVNLNDQVQNQITFQPSINTVQEFKVDNSTFSAEYGRSSGAIVNIATRSGSNDFHGEVFEFTRNQGLDAKNRFDDTKPNFKRNQFGAAVGGPIVKNQTFFFASYEGLRQRQGLSLNSVVLTDAQRAAATDPVVRRLLDFIPRPTSTDANGVARFTGAGTAPVDIDQFTVDLAHAMGSNDHLKAYYAFQKDLRGEPILQGNTLPGFGDTREGKRQIGTLDETHIFGPNLVNEARLGFNRININFSPNEAMNPADLGINGGVTAPIGLPQINIAGGALNFGGPAGFPQGRTDTMMVLSDTLSYQSGRHSLKFGGEFRTFTNDNFNNDTGTFTFLTVDDFLAGRANGFNVTLGSRPSRVTQRAAGVFVQDNFRVTSNLMLELGLRYDINFTPTEDQDRFVVFDPATVSLLRVGSGIGEVYPTSYNNIEPRVGLSWDPFKDGKTSVRVAYGRFTDQPVTNMITPLASNPPLATPLSITGPPGVVNLSNAVSAARAVGLAPNSVSRDFKNAHIQSWNLNVQREISSSLGVMIGYFGSKGSDLRLSRNLNQFVNGVRPFPRLSAASPILPGSGLGNITEIASLGVSKYNALWVSANKRMGKGLQFNASYTLSKSTDYNSLNSQGIVLQNSFDPANNEGPSDFDARHRFVINAIYELPFKGNGFVEGWQISTIAQFQSGNPLNVVVASNTLTGIGNTVRPDLTGSINVVGQTDRWFDTTAFTVPSPLRFGNLERNAVVGPGFNNVDLSIIKNVSLGGDRKLQIRAEAFDLFNHANLGQPGRIVGTPNFGRITSTRLATGDSGSSRQIQLAAKFIF